MKLKTRREEQRKLNRLKKNRWSELYFKQGFGKSNEFGIWNIGKTQYGIEETDEHFQDKKVYKLILKNKLDFRPTTKIKSEPPYFQTKDTGIRLVKDQDQYISIRFLTD